MNSRPQVLAWPKSELKDQVGKCQLERDNIHSFQLQSQSWVGSDFVLQCP